jgi:PEP-CTERM motif
MPRFVIAALGLILCSVASADTILLTLDKNFYSDYAFYSYVDTSGAANNSIPVSPYITTLNGGPYSSTLAYTFCYDFNSPTDVGVAYSGTLEVLTDTATLEATYLIDQLNAAGMINAPLATRGAISLAIWEIMNASSTTSLSNFPTDPAALPWEAAATQAVTSGAWTIAQSARYPTWVPDNPSIQRFGIVFNGETPTPEPAVPILVGIGLIALCFRRRSVRTR